MNNVDFKLLSQKLSELFVANKTRYARQLDDGNYNTVYNQITPFKIQHMLNNKGSILTYQEFNGFIKWVCLDFDIKKEWHEKDGIDAHLPVLVADVKKAINLLDSYGINYILEFSGGRGFHLWIILTRPIRKYQGYALVTTLRNKLGTLNEAIAIDLYPKTAKVNPKSKGIGLGVKLPLSCHQKSKKYSCLIDNIDDYKTYSKIEELTFSILEKQLKIIDDCSFQNFSDLKTLLNIDLSKDPCHGDFLKLVFIDINTQPTLEMIIEKLSACSCLRHILDRYQLSLNGQERHILVGLLGRLKYKDDIEYGKKLLYEIFSNLPGYNSETTKEQLELIKYYYPPSCNYIKQTLGAHKYCACCQQGVEYPIDLLRRDEFVEIIKVDPFSISEYLYKNTTYAQVKYSYYNDEVPLAINHSYLFNKAYSFESIDEEYKNILENNHEIINSFMAFQRIEARDKTRTLYVLDAKYKILSTIGLYHFQALWGKYISPESYGYKVNMSYFDGRIFESWLTLWCKYIEKIKNIINDADGDFNDYHMLKIDLKGFYDNIDIERLKVKLTSEALSLEVNQLQGVDMKKYNNLVNFLCNLCSQTVECTKGVPQGPAFARYLAEIYLLRLDEKINNFLEDGYEFYYRYVDDFFIFVETKERADALNDIISSWLSINSLQLNNTKSLTMSVKSFKEQGLLEIYLDETKYFIDQITKHKSIATKSDLKAALAQANELLSSSSFGLNDHFRFIFSHDFDDAKLNEAKTKIENMIIESNTGRGDLYRLFFDKHFLKDEIRTIPITKIQKMNPLAFENYLNSLVVTNHDFSPKHKDYIEDLVNSGLKFTDSMKSNLLQLVWKYGIDVNMALNADDYGIIKRIIESPDKYILQEKQLAFLDYTNYFEEDINTFIKEIYFFVNNNYISPKYISSLASYFWKKLSEFIGKEEKVDLKFDGVKLYNLLCLFSIVLDNGNSSDEWKANHGAILFVWEYFLKNIKNIDPGEAEGDYRSNWFECLNKKFDIISINTLTKCLTINKEGTTLGTITDPLNLLAKFKEILAIILVKDKKLFNSIGLDETQEILNELKSKDEFIKWLFSDTVKLHPDDGNLCLLNISHNNLIVMRKQDEFLVKSLCDDFPENFISGSDRQMEILKKADDAILLKDYINAREGVFEVFDKIIAVYESSKGFSNSNGCNYPNYFAQPAYLHDRDSIEPFLPFYACSEKLIPDTPQNLVENNEEGFCTLLLNYLYSLEMTIFPYPENKYSYKINDTKANKIFPVAVKTSIDKVSFLKKLASKLGSKKYCYYDFEQHWASTYWSFMEKNIMEKENLLHKFFEFYFNHHGEDPLLQLIFSVDNISLIGNTLMEFYQTIETSMSTPEISQKIIQEREDIEKIIIESTEDLTCRDFLNKHYSITSKRTPDGGESFYVNGTLFSEIEKNMFILNSEASNLFEELTELNINQFKDVEFKCYAHEDKSNIYIVVVPRATTKAYEVIAQRKEWFDKWPGGLGYELLWNCRDILSKISEDIDTIIPILENHYRDNTNIKNKLINWLLQFNPASLQDSDTWTYMQKNGFDFTDLYQSIIQIIAKHQYLNNDDIALFDYNIATLKEEGCCFFAIKKLEDNNGLHHLLSFTKADSEDRTLITDCVNNLKKATNETLCIICDNIVSGEQIEKALKFYLKGEGKNQIYHEFNDDSFGDLLVKFNKIVFLSALDTEASHIHLESFKNSEPLLRDKKIEFMSSKILTNFNYEDARIPNVKRKLFDTLIKDKKLVSNIFTAGPRYDNSIKDKELNITNLILRVKSTTKKRFFIFTVEPKQSNVGSLFYRREEHNDIIYTDRHK